MLKIFSWNVNGIRACLKNGFHDWLLTESPDIVCLQESKITIKDFLPLCEMHGWQLLDNDKAPLIENPKYYVAIATAEKAGYSGVVILTKKKPLNTEIGLGDSRYDSEGRTLIMTFPEFTLINSYVPNGGRDLERIPYKIDYSNALLARMQEIRQSQSKLILCGDLNVAHQEIDIKNPKSNRNNSGFTDIEREWMTLFLNHNYHDIYRLQNPDKRDVYTWWSYRPLVREKNIGWRIDYFITTPEIQTLKPVAEIHGTQKGSDHCPISLSLELS